MGKEKEGFKKIFEAKSPFWLITILLALGSFIYLLLWARQADSLTAAIVAIIMFAMMVSGLILSRLKIMEQGTWGQNTLSFTIGFFGWVGYLLLSGAAELQSTLVQNHLFSSIQGQLSQTVDVVSNVLLIPIAEEMFWMIGIPYTIIAIMDGLKERVPAFKKPWLQVLIITIVSAVTFAFFHVGSVSFTAFVIAAIVFRTILISMVYLDKAYNIIKLLDFTVPFALGAHLANNIVDKGVATTVTALQQEVVIFVIVGGFFLTMFLSGFAHLFQLIAKRVKSTS